MTYDLLGNEIHVADAASVAAVDDFVGGFIASEARIVNVLAAAEHDDSVIVQACAAVLHLFSESPAGPVNARPHLARAAASKIAASDRERRFARAVQAWCDDDIGSAIELLEALLRDHPRDLASLKLVQEFHFNLGDARSMLRVALGSQAAAADVPYLHGMTAFGHEQCHEMRQAEQAARRAIAMQEKEPWAHHALAHVMLTEGRIAEGRAFMQEMSRLWVGLNSFMETHNWWHLALFALEQGDDAAVLALYDDHVWGVCKEYSQDQIGAVSLLARLELAGVDVGERWQDVADHLAARTHDQVQPFLDMQYLYGLARAGRSEADALLRAVEDFAPRAPALTREAWQGVAVPACRGLLAHARGDYARAAEAMVQARPRLQTIGGSHAQRDLFEQILIDALLRSGQHGPARALLEPQLAASPHSIRLQRCLAQAAG
ncbi:MAG TPA: tetratricopeptide repeat protein [Burkholderiaceae bacterium]|nr:tetratricopeptide repeat protein [Burkholderiaceae bacterium]